MFDVTLIVLVLMNGFNFVMVLPLNIYIPIDKFGIAFEFIVLEQFF